MWLSLQATSFRLYLFTWTVSFAQRTLRLVDTFTVQMLPSLCTSFTATDVVAIITVL